MHNRYCSLSWQGSLVPAQQFWNETAIVYIARKLFLIPQDMIAFNQWPKLRVQVVSTLLPLDHMPKKQEGQDVGIVTSQESTKCCLRIPPNVLGFFGGFFCHSHTETNWISYWGDFMRCLNSIFSWYYKCQRSPASHTFQVTQLCWDWYFFWSNFPLTDYS